MKLPTPNNNKRDTGVGRSGEGRPHHRRTRPKRTVGRVREGTPAPRHTVPDAGGGALTGFGFDRWCVEASMVFCALARAVAEETGKPAVAVEVAVEPGGGRNGGSKRGLQVGAPERFCGWERLKITVTEGVATDVLLGLLGDLRKRFAHVLVGYAWGGAPERLVRPLVAEAGETFVYLDGREPKLVKRAGELGTWGRRVRPVLWRRRGERVVGLDEVAGVSGFAEEAFVRWRGRYGSDVGGHLRAVARAVGKCRVGLALSSGSAKGLAHIGVIQVLEENGIEVDVVAGTSMGAYVGACWCVGMDGGALQRLAADVQGRRGVWGLVDPVLPPRRGFIRGRRVRERLQRSVAGVRFEELARDLHVVATDWETLGRRVFRAGDVSEAVHASLAMPGVCEPVEVDGRAYIDGAACAPLPVGVLEEMGVERIIAVNVLPSVADLAARSAGEESPEGLARRAGAWLNGKLNVFAAGNLLDNLMRGLQAGQLRMAQAAEARADVAVRAYPPGARWFGFDCHAEYISAGRAAAHAVLPALKALVAKPERRAVA